MIGVSRLSSALPILVFQHMPAEHPGYLFERLRADSVPFRILRLDLDEPIPDLNGYSAVWALGGPMDVWEEDEHPWLIPEKQAIRDAVLVRKIPYFGVCLGHQLLAAALGGEVGPASAPEMGVFDVGLSETGTAHPLLDGLPTTLGLVQWHLAEVKQAPPGADVLASSENCPIHGLGYGNRVLGLQSHIEVSLATVREWLSSPKAIAQLELHLGPDAAKAFELDVAAHIHGSNAAAGMLYDRLIETLEPV